MQTIEFKSSNGLLEGTVTYKGKQEVDEELLGNMVSSLLNHMAAHIGVLGLPTLFNRISDMRTEYLEAVLRYLVETATANGINVPNDVRASLAEEPKLRWEMDNDEEN